MGSFKRLCMVVFGIVGVLTMAALILPWIGPWTAQATALLALDWYLFVIELFLVLLGIGFLVVLVRGIGARKPKDIVVADDDGDTITIARSAVASQATYLVEADGTCAADKVRVDTRHGRVDVAIAVEPYHSMDVRAEAARLQKSLRKGLGVLVGDALGDITLRFEEPRTTADITPGDTVRPAKSGAYVPTAVHRADRGLRHGTGTEPEAPVAYGAGPGAGDVKLETPGAVGEGEGEDHE